MGNEENRTNHLYTLYYHHRFAMIRRIYSIDVGMPNECECTGCLISTEKVLKREKKKNQWVGFFVRIAALHSSYAQNSLTWDLWIHRASNEPEIIVIHYYRMLRHLNHKWIALLGTVLLLLLFIGTRLLLTWTRIKYFIGIFL